MVSANYVGKRSTASDGVVNKVAVVDEFSSGVSSRTSVSSRISALATTGSTARATKSYIDNADLTFAEAAYYISQDALNVPVDSRGAPNGVAALNSSGKIPSAQVPPLGYGTLRGPWGITSVTSAANVGTTPAKIGSLTIGVTAWNFRALVFAIAQIEATELGQPVVEVRIGTSSQTTYASQTLVASGVGRAAYDDTQIVTVLPCAATTGAMSDGTQTYIGPNTDARLTFWLYHGGDSAAGQVSASNSALFTVAAYIARVVQ